MYKINSHPDKSTYVEVEKTENLYPEITFRINSNKDLWTLNQLVDATIS